MSRTGYLYHARYADHDTGPGSVERPQRAVAVHERLTATGLLDELSARDPEPLAAEDLYGVHAADYVRGVEAAMSSAPARLEADTMISRDSYDVARLAAGAAVQAVDLVLAGEWSNAFVCARPPGHHAERNAAMGFCLFNNVAVAADHLRRHRGLERVAILDWDVHHGNGTQHLFEEDPSVFYASLHQWPHYPGTGAASERGRGEGVGATKNCPLPAGSGDAEWLHALERDVLPALEAFRPEFVLISAGFDAHRDDPLSGTRVTEDGYRILTRRMLELARTYAGGRLVSLLEGGYDLNALARSVEVHVGELVAAGREASA